MLLKALMDLTGIGSQTSLSNGLNVKSGIPVLGNRCGYKSVEDSAVTILQFQDRSGIGTIPVGIGISARYRPRDNLKLRPDCPYPYDDVVGENWGCLNNTLDSK